MSKRNKNTNKIFLDGAQMRLHNRKIGFVEKDDNILINFKFADTEADKPACKHICHRGKVRETHLQLSVEAMETLMMGYIRYRQFKEKNKAK
jgi:hypothetical protein